MYNPMFDSWSPEVNLEIPIEDIRRNMEMDLSQYVEVRSHRTKSGHEVRLSYIPWHTAYELLREYNKDLYPAVEFFNGVPFVSVEEQGCLVYPFIMDKTSGKRTPALVYAVRDQYLASPVKPTVDTITNNIQRAMVKAIAQFTGIGWSVYTSDESVEIIPPQQQQPQPPQQPSQFGRYSPHSEPLYEQPPAQPPVPPPQQQFSNYPKWKRPGS